MDTVTLCRFCSNINFEALRYPLTSDLPALRECRVDTSRHPFRDKRDDAHKTTLLGSFSDIIQRSNTCRLCQLIKNALSRQVNRQPAEHDVCHAETSFYGLYRDPRGKNYWIRRLSILVEIETDAYSAGGPKKSLFYAFQACDVGAASVQVDGRFVDPRPGTDMMIFGGRCRPLLLDLRWVQRWMNICKTGHGTKCERADIGSKKLERVRFVDVKQRCLVTLEGISLSEHQYIALSYVWGGPQKLKLARRNKNDLACRVLWSSKLYLKRSQTRCF
ncbi:hypothetical protein GGR55DRAFT_683962 [Xylaria sp. FL0064]|nr:hypothetical protein GGR55DRAFT_683962 [Xylaria sp. FL0064]